MHLVFGEKRNLEEMNMKEF